MNNLILSYSSHNLDSIIEKIKNNDPALFMFFYGADNNYKDFEKKLNALSIPYIGCMDSGRLVAGRYLLDNNSIVGMSISKKVINKIIIDSIDMSPDRTPEIIKNESREKFVKAAAKLGIDLQNPDMERDIAIDILYGLNSATPVLEGQSVAGLMLQTAGGSSGGKTDFKESNVISSAGSGHVGAFALIRFNEKYKFVIDRISSFDTVSINALEVTKLAGPRHILELNNKPATEEYCSKIGIDISELKPDTFANYTLGLEPGDGERFITSIMMKDDAAGLITYNDVIIGTKFNLYKSKKQEQDRINGLKKIADKNIIGFISFDCILCYLARNTLDEVNVIAKVYEDVLPGIPKIGFGTFSENICGVNVNQTETYLAVYEG